MSVSTQVTHDRRSHAQEPQNQDLLPVIQVLGPVSSARCPRSSVQVLHLSCFNTSHCSKTFFSSSDEQEKTRTSQTQIPNTETKPSFCFCQDFNSQPESPRSHQLLHGPAVYPDDSASSYGPGCSLLTCVSSFLNHVSVRFTFDPIQTPRERVSENPHVLYLHGLKSFNSPQLEPFT